MPRAKQRLGRRWTRWTEEEAQRFLKGWRRGGQSLASYCRTQGVAYERVRRWRKKLEGGRAAPPVELREVDLSAIAPTPVAEIELELRTGHVLRLRGSAEIRPLVDLARLLEST